MGRQRRVLAKFVGGRSGISRGMFELADGRRVEVDGAVGLDSPEAPQPGEKALVVLDERGRALRWEPYAGRRLERGLD